MLLVYSSSSVDLESLSIGVEFLVAVIVSTAQMTTTNLDYSKALWC